LFLKIFFKISIVIEPFRRHRLLLMRGKSGPGFAVQTRT